MSSEIDDQGNVYLAKYNYYNYTTIIEKTNAQLLTLWTKQISNNTNNNSIYIPTNLYFNRNNNKLYLWGVFNKTVNVLGNYFTVAGNDNSIFQSLLCEFKVDDGQLERIARFDNNSNASIASYAGNSRGNTAYFSSIDNNLYIQSSFSGKMQFSNTAINSSVTIPFKYREELVLFKINLSNFFTEYILKSNSSPTNPYGYTYDLPGPIIIKNDDIFLTSKFESKPIYILNNEIANNSGNNNSDGLVYKHSTNSTLIPSLSTSNQTFCTQENATLSNINITGQNIKWYDAQTGGNFLPTNIPLQNGVTYYATQTINNCESERIGVSIIIYNTPAPTATANQSFCSTQNATIADIVVTGSSIKWYSNPTATTSLPSTTPLQHNTTYYASQTLNNCESVERVAVTITLINTFNANNFSTYFCDDLDAGHIVLDLTYYNTSLISSVTGNTFSYYTTYLGAQNQTASDRITNFGNYNLLVGTSKIYVRIDNTNSCFQIVELDLTLYGKPKINIDDIKPICEGNTITVNPGNFDSYLWSTGATSPSLTIGIEGNYSVMVTQNHSGINCSTTKSFKVVKSNKATIEKTITTDWTSDSNSITIIITSGSVGDYEYSLDGINYQTSNTFTNLANGKYTVYIRDKNGCGITEEEVYLLMYPKFFTPNNDGYNDYWKIKFAVEEPNIIIKIFDRYGKLLKQLSNDSQGWDGTYLEQALPADDYWFTLIRANGNEYKGHFSLKR
ncbi:MAG: T9SS type B sorting domain-containing protein [Limnohabitans sp.]|nr:T9SS type B sorting domain-containing protein [Limnohabitans sp.]